MSKPTVEELDAILNSDEPCEVKSLGPDGIIAVPTDPEKRKTAFRDSLERLINCHSLENGSDTPDFILANYLLGCLENFDKTVARRDQWYGHKGLSDAIDNRTNACPPV